MPATEPVRPASTWSAVVEARSGEKVSRCYQCRKCASGCPLAFAMDVLPNQVMRMIQFGMERELLESASIQICASCQTCTTRCPNGIDIARVMDTLRQLGREMGVAADPRVVKFHEAFLDSVRRHGRVFELGMVARYKLSARDFFSGAKLGWEMFKRGKLKLLPSPIRGKDEIRAMFDRRPED